VNNDTPVFTPQQFPSVEGDDVVVNVARSGDRLIVRIHPKSSPTPSLELSLGAGASSALATVLHAGSAEIDAIAMADNVVSIEGRRYAVR
jgi:hypothetical protein